MFGVGQGQPGQHLVPTGPAPGLAALPGLPVGPVRGKKRGIVPGQVKQPGYTLNEITEIMHDADQGRSPSRRVRETLGHSVLRYQYLQHVDADVRHLGPRPGEEPGLPER